MSATNHEWPALSAELDAHAERVRAHVAERIAASGGFLRFDAYMHEALYAPGLGYYVAGLEKFGAGGDFVTAPEVSPLFGRVLARNVATVLDTLGSTTVVEFGPGTGALAEAIVGWFAGQGRALDYRLVEISPDLAARQRERLAGAGNDDTRISWVTEPAANAVRGVIVANEVADALPVRRFRCVGGDFVDIGVALTGGRLRLAERPADAAMRADLSALEARRGAPLPDGYASEYAPALPGWVTSLAGMLEAGLLLIADYGAGARDYYGDERDGGTFRGHLRHQVIDDPLPATGLADMTAWVDFTAVAEAGVAAGLELAGFTTQAAFLIGGGLADECTGRFDPAATPAVAAAIRTLTLPGEMGERFRFLGLGRGTLPPVAGFGFRDLTHSL